MIDHYKKEGWVIIPKVFSKKDLDILSDWGYNMRIEWDKHSTWKGISCAGKFSQPLTEIYTSDIMKGIATDILGTPHLFNDQMVYKLPHDKMNFVPHYDNQYSLRNKGNDIHTVNLSIAIDDFTRDNGALHIRDKDDEWQTLLPKAGDIVAINGSTVHASHENRSDKPRGLYACVYTEAPMEMEGYYNEPFVGQQKKIKIFSNNA
tara:strand:+ start:177 stop:791 length:615 start_codon:yes stop_codon:yes gene_type:complete